MYDSCLRPYSNFFGKVRQTPVTYVFYRVLPYSTVNEEVRTQ